MSVPDNWVPQILPVSLIVARSEDLAISVSKIAVFPAGFEFETTALSRLGLGQEHLNWPQAPGRSEPLVGIRYASGASATYGPPPNGFKQNGITLLQNGGTGTETTQQRKFWVSPLPPEGPVMFAAAWPDRGVGEATVTLDGSAFIAAADAAVELWPDAVDDPEADFSDAPPLPPEGIRPADAEESDGQIRAAFSQVFDNGPQMAADPLVAVQDGASLAGALAQVRSRFPVEAATTRVAVGRVVFLDDRRAAVTYRFIIRTGFPGFGTELGYAVRERGQWKVARDTYCRVLGRAGVQCPPAPPPE